MPGASRRDFKDRGDRRRARSALRPMQSHYTIRAPSQQKKSPLNQKIILDTLYSRAYSLSIETANRKATDMNPRFKDTVTEFTASLTDGQLAAFNRIVSRLVDEGNAHDSDEVSTLVLDAIRARVYS